MVYILHHLCICRAAWMKSKGTVSNPSVALSFFSRLMTIACVIHVSSPAKRVGLEINRIRGSGETSLIIGSKA